MSQLQRRIKHWRPPYSSTGSFLSRSWTKDRKFNRTIQTKLPLRAPVNPIFIVKTMTDTSPRQLPWQELAAPTPKTGTPQTRRTSASTARKKLLITKRYADRTRTPVQAEPPNPIRGRRPPAPEPLPPPTAAGRAPGRCTAAAPIRRGGPESSAPNCLR